MNSCEVMMNCTVQETRVAQLENGHVSELYIERTQERGIVGNIYRGKVVRVLPGMQAAFVDIGLDKAAFLYVTDIYPDFQDMDFGEEDSTQAAAIDAADSSKKKNGSKDPDTSDSAKGVEDRSRTKSSKSSTNRKDRNSKFAPRRKIEDLITTGQEILVQVTKEAIGTKGPRITSHVTVPGRYLVLMPTVARVGLSRRTIDFRMRRRLRQLLNANRPPGMGFIVRTAAADGDETEILRDLNFLMDVWREVGRNTKKAPVLLHSDLPLALRTVRDLDDHKTKRIVVDDKEVYEQLQNFMTLVMPNSKTKAELYQGQTPLFDRYKIEKEIEKITEKKVWLKSGGYLIFDQAEALCAIDVNTGRYVGKTDLEDTILKTNLEAADEIVNQLRLRSIGGLIIIDFIDMENLRNREKVFNLLAEEVRRDGAKSHVTKISDLGLVEMTRKRTGDSLGQLLSEPCSYCEGKGSHKSRVTISHEIYRTIIRQVKKSRAKTIFLDVHPTIADALFGQERLSIERLEKSLGIEIIIKASNHLHIEKFHVTNEPVT